MITAIFILVCAVFIGMLFFIAPRRLPRRRIKTPVAFGDIGNTDNLP